MRKPINYSKCYSRRSRKEEIREEKKDTLKKVGYFVAGAATAVGVGYGIKKICEEKYADVNLRIFHGVNDITVDTILDNAPKIFKCYPFETTMHITPETAKEMAQALIEQADLLVKKE